ncbi:MAG: AAA family ATPase [Variovorax sp.]
MLIVLGGLPGTGKTAIARKLAVRSPSVYLRIDTIEQALMKVSALKEVGPAGYVIAYELARSNLALGMIVVADCVNPLSVTREAWRAVAASTSSGLLEVEVVCSDPAEHRRRVEGRTADISDFKLPTWEAVLNHQYEPWTTSRLIIDSALFNANEAATLICERLRGDPQHMEPTRQTPNHLLSVQEELVQREPIFHRPEQAATRAALESVTAPEFWETGASGKRYSRSHILDIVEGRLAASHQDDWKTEDFYCQQIAPDNYLLTYTLHQGSRVTRRATLWRRAVGGWVIVYHQGTVVEST